MNRVELIELLSEQHQLSKAEAGRVLRTLTEAIVNTVRKGGSVSITGFGTFKQVSRAARTGRNPRTGDKVKIAAAKLPKFSAGSQFKAAVDPKGAARKAAKAAAAPAKALAKKAAAKPAAKKGSKKA
jgi:DNA-binding protein HU-beta